MDVCSACLVPILVIACILAGIRAQNYQMTFTILEERSKDTYIGNVTNNPQFIADIPAEEFGYIRFGFLKQTYVQTILTLHEMTGVITTAVVIDRESRNICQSQVVCELSFNVAVRSARPQSSFFAIIAVTLVIEDINDNAPLFPHDILSLEISESATAGTSFHIESAVDPDAGINSVQSYEIRQQDGDFSLNVIKKLDGSFTVKLIVNSQLDRETKDSYRVVIVASDGGNPKKFGALAVNISVTDINDNAPVFVEKSYNITVRENITVDSTVLQLSATDKDIGENGRVTFRFAKNQLDAQVNDLFRLTPDLGELKLKSRLVYSSDRSYRIIAEAVDNGAQPQATQVIITVHVIDVGNNRPIVEVNLIGKENSRIVNLSESASPGTFVAHINVIDMDKGDNGIVDCQISDNKFDLQSMSGKGFKVVVKGELDRESQDLHHIQISCHDYGTPQLSASSSFLVSLSDENDCAPIFTHEIFTGTIPENSEDFRPFVQIIAFDEDYGNNSVVRYFIDRESTDLKFLIDELDGTLRADQTFDREAMPVIMFKVIARDLGSPSLSNKATVKLTISDMNDNAPDIKDPVVFSIIENEQSGSFVGVLRATDADAEGVNSRVMFLIDPVMESTVPFVVFPDGKIQTNRELDREAQNIYKFNVLAVDQGTPRLSSSALVTVLVNDSNDNEPRLTFPKEKNNTAVIYSDVKPGHKVAQIFAEDLDDGLNAIMTYDIIKGNTEGLFVIDTQSGGIYLNKQVDIIHNKTFHLTIAVRDGLPKHTVESDLYIVMVKAVNSTQEEDSSSNKTIVVIVVVLTVVLSVIMIITICFLRRFDHRSKARRNLDIVAPDEKYPKCYMDSTSRYMDSSLGSNDHLTLTYDPMSPGCPKKKEVSFDIDDHLDHSDLRDQHNTTMSTFSVPECEKVRLIVK